jgi:hypothetical protein
MQGYVTSTHSYKRKREGTSGEAVVRAGVVAVVVVGSAWPFRIF